jgi:hypothetical protein
MNPDVDLEKQKQARQKVKNLRIPCFKELEILFGF